MKNIAIWTLLICGCITLFAFARVEHADNTCWRIDVEVEQLEGLYFINEQAIRDQISSTMPALIGQKLIELPINKIQDTIESLPSVKEAIVYANVDGRLSVHVSQRKPAIRIMNQDGSGYYLDTAGKKMPLSSAYTAKVPVVVGALQESFETPDAFDVEHHPELADKTCMDEIFNLVKAIEEDPFWIAQVDHVTINKRKEFELIPRVGNHKVLFGTCDHASVKLKKLKAFYLKTSHAYNLNSYKQIDARFRDQIIGIRYY